MFRQHESLNVKKVYSNKFNVETMLLNLRPEDDVPCPDGEGTLKVWMVKDKRTKVRLIGTHVTLSDTFYARLKCLRRNLVISTRVNVTSFSTSTRRAMRCDTSFGLGKARTAASSNKVSRSSSLKIFIVITRARCSSFRYALVFPFLEVPNARLLANDFPKQRDVAIPVGLPRTVHYLPRPKRRYHGQGRYVSLARH
jgi:hypothetical protein